MARKGRKGLRGKNSKERTDFHIRSNIFQYLQGIFLVIRFDDLFGKKSSYLLCSSNKILIIVISYILIIVPLDIFSPQY